MIFKMLVIHVYFNVIILKYDSNYIYMTFHIGQPHTLLFTFA